MKPSEIRDRDEGELDQLEQELRDQLVKIAVAHATQRHRNTSQVGKIKRDIARIKTIRRERSGKETRA